MLTTIQVTATEGMPMDYDITLPYNLSEIKKLQAKYNHKPQNVYESDFDNRSGRSYANILLLSAAVMLCQLISG